MKVPADLVVQAALQQLEAVAALEVAQVVIQMVVGTVQTVAPTVAAEEVIQEAMGMGAMALMVRFVLSGVHPDHSHQQIRETCNA